MSAAVADSADSAHSAATECATAIADSVAFAAVVYVAAGYADRAAHLEDASIDASAGPDDAGYAAGAAAAGRPAAAAIPIRAVAAASSSVVRAPRSSTSVPWMSHAAAALAV